MIEHVNKKIIRRVPHLWPGWM